MLGPVRPFLLERETDLSDLSSALRVVFNANTFQLQ